LIKNLLITSIIGGLIGLDRTAIFQTMISQPIVAAPVMGLLLGNFAYGIAVGIVLQLIWLPSLQIGAAIVCNSTLASVLVTASTIEVSNSLSQPAGSFPSIAAFSLFLSLPLLIIEQKMDIFVRKTNVFWVKEAEKLINNGKSSLIGVINLSGIIFFFIKNFIFLLLSTIVIATVIKKSYFFLPVNFIEGFNLFFGLMPLLGIAVVLESVLLKRNYIYFFLGIVTTILLNLILENR